MSQVYEVVGVNVVAAVFVVVVVVVVVPHLDRDKLNYVKHFKSIFFRVIQI